MSEPVEHEIESDPVEAILLWRLYDVMSALLSEISPEKFTAIMRSHEQGLFVTPPPAYRVPDGD